MENAKYIYLQISQEIHNDRPRILTESENQTRTIYIETLSSDELNILTGLINMINTRINKN